MIGRATDEKTIVIPLATLDETAVLLFETVEDRRGGSTGSAVRPFPDPVPQLVKRRWQVGLPIFQQPQSGADDLAGAVEPSGLDLAVDEVLEMVTEDLVPLGQKFGNVFTRPGRGVASRVS